MLAVNRTEGRTRARLGCTAPCQNAMTHTYKLMAPQSNLSAGDARYPQVGVHGSTSSKRVWGRACRYPEGAGNKIARGLGDQYGSHGILNLSGIGMGFREIVLGTWVGVYPFVPAPPSPNLSSTCNDLVLVWLLSQRIIIPLNCTKMMLKFVKHWHGHNSCPSFSRSSLCLCLSLYPFLFDSHLSRPSLSYFSLSRIFPHTFSLVEYRALPT